MTGRAGSVLIVTLIFCYVRSSVDICKVCTLNIFHFCQGTQYSNPEPLLCRKLWAPWSLLLLVNYNLSNEVARNHSYGNRANYMILRNWKSTWALFSTALIMTAALRAQEVSPVGRINSGAASVPVCPALRPQPHHPLPRPLPVLQQWLGRGSESGQSRRRGGRKRQSARPNTLRGRQILSSLVRSVIVHNWRRSC